MFHFFLKTKYVYKKKLLEDCALLVALVVAIRSCRFYMNFFRVFPRRLLCMQVKLVCALKIKEQLIVLGYMEKVEQVHKRTETDNNRRTVIHWFYWGEQEEMELTWTYPQTRPRNNSQKSNENYFWKKVKCKIQRKKKSNNSHHNKSLYKENQGGQSFLWH